MSIIRVFCNDRMLLNNEFMIILTKEGRNKTTTNLNIRTDKEVKNKAE